MRKVRRFSLVKVFRLKYDFIYIVFLLFLLFLESLEGYDEISISSLYDTVIFLVGRISNYLSLGSLLRFTIIVE